jgi:hypothetical protein
MHRKEKLTDKEFDKHLLNLQNQFNEMQAAAKINKTVAKKIATIDFPGINIALNDIFSSRKSGKSYKEIFKNKKSENVPAAMINEMDKVNSQRDKSLIKTLNKHSGLFTVAVTGSAHATAEYVKEELSKGADQNPYAILAMVN